MFKILNQLYPFPESNPTKRLLNCVAEGVFIGLFLVIFQPFGGTSWNHPHKILILAGYGLVAFFCGLMLRFVIPKIIPEFFKEQDWTVGREILKVMAMLLMIAAGNLVYAYKFTGGSFSLENFVLMFLIVALLGFFPITFGVMANYIYQLKKYSTPVVVHKNMDIETMSNPMRLIAENDKDFLEIMPPSLLYIESSDNYSTVFYEKENRLEKELIRSSLSRLESQITDKNIVRCHRSFIVNLSQVDKITGNAQGYKFHLNTPNLVVPVARRYSYLVENLR